MTHNNQYCPKYKDEVLPNEENKCSLCNEKLSDDKQTEYKIIIAIEKDILLEMADNDDVIAAIEQELGWVEESGIRVVSIEKIN